MIERDNTREARIFKDEFYPENDALQRFAIKLTRNKQDADDLVQDTYVRALEYIDSYKEGTGARSWLFTIMKTHFINGFRKKSSRPIEDDFKEVEFIAVDNDQDNSIGDRLATAFKSIPPKYSLTIALAAENYTYKEIGQVLDIPEGSVRSRLKRARFLIKDKINNL